MQRLINILFIFVVFINNVFAQSPCSILVDTANILHISCPNGGPVGSAQILQTYYINYSWQNVTNGQLYNGGGGSGGAQRNDLDAGLYVITASNPYSNSCPDTIYSDTFEIIEASPFFQFNPTQACPDTCNVEVNQDMLISIPGISYTSSFNNSMVAPLPYILDNQCGGMNFYEIYANGISCGVQNIAISQFAQMNLSTDTISSTCQQPGSATVNITGVGASAINTYCVSFPQYSNYSTITDVSLIGDNFSINNYTGCPNTLYSDYTILSADISPGNTYNIDLDLGTCHPAGFALLDIANVYIDWNIDGDFDDINELIAAIPSTQSPSTHTLNFTVPLNAIPGQSRMRIVMQNYDYQPYNNAGPCDNTSWFGETEDYTIQVNGSVATPVSYLWSDGQTTQTAINLVAGQYSVLVTDANGCNASDTIVIAGSGNTISVSASADQIICNGYAPSSLNASSGGVSGTYSWVNSSNPLVILGNGPSFSPPPLTSTTTYTVTFTENVTGCTTTDDVVITVVPLTTPTFNQIAPICAGGSFTLSTNSTNGISGIWSPAPNFTATTTYTFSPIGALTCVTNTTMTVVVNPIPTVTLTANPNPACIGNNILLTANSTLASLYRFQYNSGGSWVNFTNPVFSSLSTQIFSNIQNSTDFRVKVREANGCTASPWSNITVPVNAIVTPPISHN